MLITLRLVFLRLLMLLVFLSLLWRRTTVSLALLVFPVLLIFLMLLTST